MTRSIRIPNGRSVTIPAYVAAWKSLKGARPDLKIRGWDHFPCSAADVLRAFTYGLHDRINQRGGIVVRESRASMSILNMARTPRVRIEPSAGARFSPAARRALAQRIHAFDA